MAQQNYPGVWRELLQRRNSLVSLQERDLAWLDSKTLRSRRFVGAAKFMLGDCNDSKLAHCVHIGFDRMDFCAQATSLKCLGSRCAMLPGKH